MRVPFAVSDAGLTTEAGGAVRETTPPMALPDHQVTGSSRTV